MFARQLENGLAHECECKRYFEEKWVADFRELCPPAVSCTQPLSHSASDAQSILYRRPLIRMLIQRLVISKGFRFFQSKLSWLGRQDDGMGILSASPS
jgi:hypothetical protein